MKQRVRDLVLREMRLDDAKRLVARAQQVKKNLRRRRIEVGKLAQNVQPRLPPGKGLRRVTRPAPVSVPGTFGGRFGACGNRDELELDGRQVPCPAVQPHPPELRANAAALQIAVGPGVHVPAEHAGAHKRNLDCAVHRDSMCIAQAKQRQSISIFP